MSDDTRDDTIEATARVDALAIEPYTLNFRGYRVLVANCEVAKRGGGTQRAISYEVIGEEMPPHTLAAFQERMLLIYSDPMVARAILSTSATHRAELEQAAIDFFEIATPVAANATRH